MFGTITKRGEHSYLLRVSNGTQADGKQIRFSKTVRCKNEKEAQKELALFYSAVMTGQITKDNLGNLGGLCEYWLKNYAKKNYKTSSFRSIQPALKSIIPALGDIQLSKLRRLDIQKWIDSLECSPKTIKNYYGVLRSVMRYAILMELIEKNPCDNVILPKQQKKESAFYNKQEIQQLINALSAVPDNQLKYRCAIEIGLFGGLRKGEIMGLNWSDVDFNNNTIRIERTRIAQVGMGLCEETPKTSGSVRTVSLPLPVMNRLQQLKNQQQQQKLAVGSEWKDSPAVLQATLGGAMYPQVLQKWFARFQKKNNLPKLGLHGLRHTHASMLADMNVETIVISKRLGHSQISTTLNIYTHLLEDKGGIISEGLTDQYFRNNCGTMGM